MARQARGLSAAARRAREQRAAARVVAVEGKKISKRILPNLLSFTQTQNELKKHLTTIYYPLPPQLLRAKQSQTNRIHITI